MFTRQDIENEMRVIEQLQRAGDEGGGGKENIIDILGHGRFGGPFSFHYIDMELCDINLYDYIYNRRVVADMPPFRRNSAAFVLNVASPTTKILNIWTIMQHIAAGLAFIHLHGQVHRDMKPRNGGILQEKFLILVVLYSSARECWKIADFGCTAEATSVHAPTTVMVRGTTSYRAPELLEQPGNFTNKVDIWAMGCIL
jgi:serine/threonine protein kinase